MWKGATAVLEPWNEVASIKVTGKKRDEWTLLWEDWKATVSKWTTYLTSHNKFYTAGGHGH
jgi:hypothetical protein